MIWLKMDPNDAGIVRLLQQISSVHLPFPLILLDDILHLHMHMVYMYNRSLARYHFSPLSNFVDILILIGHFQ